MVSNCQSCNSTRPFFCEVLQRKMSPHLAHLCKTKPAYRIKWEQERDGVHKPPYTKEKYLIQRLDALDKRCKPCKGSKPVSHDKLLEEVLSGTGPGSQLWHLFSRLGIQHTAECSCVLLADIMNGLGPQGCKENRAKLLKLMYKNKKKYGWHDTLTAAKNIIVRGWLFKINPLDPLSSLLDEAIKLSEQAECQSHGNTA